MPADRVFAPYALDNGHRSSGDSSSLERSNGTAKSVPPDAYTMWPVGDVPRVASTLEEWLPHARLERLRDDSARRPIDRWPLGSLDDREQQRAAVGQQLRTIDQDLGVVQVDEELWLASVGRDSA